jgi:hypothetical protein
MNMVATGDPNPHNFFYPSLLFDVMAFVVAVGHAAFGWPLTTDTSWLFMGKPFRSSSTPTSPADGSWPRWAS